MRDLAVSELRLPDNRSYRALRRSAASAAVWNVVAAPELSLQLKTWCFPVVGWSATAATTTVRSGRAGSQLRAEGWDVSVYGVPAYSTLGWSDWFGGDPLLNTFVQWPEGELARMIFHELAHQNVYVADDTTFNESFATAVERIGARHGCRSRPARRPARNTRALRCTGARISARSRRACASACWPSTAGRAARPASGRPRPRPGGQLRREYEALKAQRWTDTRGLRRAGSLCANNAALGVLGAYNDVVPAASSSSSSRKAATSRASTQTRQGIGRVAEGAAPRHTTRHTIEHRGDLRGRTSAFTANTRSACPRPARWPGNGPRTWRRTSTCNAR